MAFLLNRISNLTSALRPGVAHHALKRVGIAAAVVTLGAFSNSAAADYTVQIGAFGTQPASAFTTDAADYGEVLVMQGDDGITRVSIGRYDSRTAAREALTRLQIAGYTDAYVANIRGRDASQATATRQPAQITQPVTATARTLTNPNVERSQRLPSGRAIVPPKQAPNPAASGADTSNGAQAGRFRLRTHDTQSGKTTDVQLSGSTNINANSGTRRQEAQSGVVAGMGVSDLPAHLRNKLVYLDGVPHIKEGDQFIPLTDAIDGKP